MSLICSNCQFGQLRGDSEVLGHINSWQVLRCPRCYLVYVHPQPGQDEIFSFYKTYHDKTGQEILCKTGENLLFKQVLDHIHRIQPTGQLLDIGSSYGYFMKAAQKYGYDPVGVEMVSAPCEFARIQLGLEVFNGQLEDARFETGRFSVVTLLNVLEHLWNPYATMCEVYRLLEPCGIIAIVVPNLNFGYPFLFWCSRVLRHSNFKIGISVFDVPAHLFLFTPTTLRRLLLDAGFTAVSIANAPVIHNLSPIKTLAKLSVKTLTDFLYWLSNGVWILNYSMLAIAQKPNP